MVERRPKTVVLAELCASKCHRSWLERYRKEEQKLWCRRHRKLQDLSSTQQQIYQFLSLFSVFQGIVLTALVQSNTDLGCQRWWVPFTISLTTTMVTLVSLVPKLRRLHYRHWELDQINGEVDAILTAIDKIMTHGALLDISNPSNEPLDILSSSNVVLLGTDTPLHLRLLYVVRNYAFDIVVFVTVILVSSIIMFWCYRLLCRPIVSDFHAACNATCNFP